MLLVGFVPPCIRCRYKSLNAASATQILMKAFSAHASGAENCLIGIGDTLSDHGSEPETKFGLVFLFFVMKILIIAHKSLRYLRLRKPFYVPSHLCRCHRPSAHKSRPLWIRSRFRSYEYDVTRNFYEQTVDLNRVEKPRYRWPTCCWPEVSNVVDPTAPKCRKTTESL